MLPRHTPGYSEHLRRSPVLGASTITNTGSSTISGSVGLFGGSSITGFPPGLVTQGTIHTTDAVAQQAQTDETTAYQILAALPSRVNESGTDLGGLTLTPGVYSFSSTAALNGALTLDFQGLSNALFIFQVGSTLTTGSSSTIQVINGSATDGIYWQVGSSATLGSSTAFAGNILALTSITLVSGAKIECGRAFAQTGAVTMDTNVISNNCSVDNFGSGRSDFGSGGFSSAGTTAVAAPEPAGFLLLGIGLLVVLPNRFRRRT
jgi:hypothetical protein